MIFQNYNKKMKSTNYVTTLNLLFSKYNVIFIKKLNFQANWV